MINKRFELYKVKREIRRNGQTFDFYRALDKNEFGEPSEEYKKIHTINCLYYEHSPHYLDTYMLMSVAEAAKYRSRKTPQIICPYEDMFFKTKKIDEETGEEIEVQDNLMIGDFVNLNGHLIKITGVFNIQEWNLLITISFEVVDYGSQSRLPGGEKPD